MNSPTRDTLDTQHEEILRLQREIIREHMVQQYDDGEIHKIPTMGQRAGFEISPSEGWSMRHIYHAGNFDIFLFCGTAEHKIPMHSTNSTTTLHMRKGIIDVVRENKHAYQLTQGDTLVIPSNTRHQINAIKDAEVLIEFSPPVVHPHSVFPALKETSIYADHHTQE